MKLLLVNPNTNRATTAQMVAIAAESAGPTAAIIGLTARSGASLIVDEAHLLTAARAVECLAPAMLAEQCDGVIVSAFGDPGLDALRARLEIPVTGIAEAAMREASAGGRRFAVVTTTPQLVASIEATARRLGHEQACLGVLVTPHDPVRLMRDPEALEAALASACELAIANLPVDAIIIGGGPLAAATRRLRSYIGVTLVEPIPAAVRLATLRYRDGDQRR